MNSRNLKFYTALIALSFYTYFANATPGFVGEDGDSDTRMTFLRSHYYDPETGGYLTKDCLGKCPSSLITILQDVKNKASHQKMKSQSVQIYDNTFN